MRSMTRVVAVAALTVGLSGAALAQSSAKKPAHAAAPPDPKVMMEMMQKAATPGPMHKKLDAIIGTFDASVRTWMDPTKPPEDSQGTAVNAWVLGNRYVETKYEGTFMGEPFSGLGFTGYDNVTKKYIGVWMDTASTGVMASNGTLDAGGKVLTSKVTMSDPTTGKVESSEQKTTITDNDHHSMEMWAKTPDGKSFKVMEITYTRKK